MAFGWTILLGIHSVSYLNNAVLTKSSVSSVQSLSHVQLLCYPEDGSMPGFPVRHQPLSLLKLTSVESVLPSKHLILCDPLLLLPSILPSTRVFSKDSGLRISCTKYWSFSFSISHEYLGLISLRFTALISLQSKGLSRVFSNTTVQKHHFFGAQLSLWFNSHIHDYWKNNSFD